MKRMVQLILCLMLASTTLAQGFGLPPGKWWKMPRVVNLLELTGDQQHELDEVFRKSAPQLIDLKAELEKATVVLRSAVDKSEIDRDEVRRAASLVNDARANLFERELMLLIDMRSVLTEPQWKELRRALDEQRRNMHQRRPPERRGRPDPPRKRF